MIVEITALVLVAIFAAVMREYYGNKGVFIKPHNVPDKGYALGSLGAVLAALLAVLINYALIPNQVTISIAITLGLAWGIAAPDVVANLFARRATQP